MKSRFIGVLLVIISTSYFPAHAQLSPAGTQPTLQQASLPNCIQYALEHQPLIRQSVIDQEIADRTVRSSLAAWYPQVNAGYNILHYLKLPVTLIPDATTGERRPVALGAQNTSTASFSL